MKKHSLFGKVELLVEVDVETSCKDCIHKMVCDRNMANRCKNYHFGNSSKRGCEQCHHHFTRFHKESIPCFFCEDFLSA